MNNKAFTKVLDLAGAQLKAGPKGHGRMSGYAAIFHVKDLVGDIILPGAFKRTIPSLLSEGFVTVGHDDKKLPIATIDVARETNKGLWVEMDFHSHPEAQAARSVSQERIERGKTVKLSFMFRVPEGGAEYSKDARFLKDLDVFEVGWVNLPAQPLALVGDTKMAAHWVRELKAGRVLSESNRQRVRALLDALDATDPLKRELRALLAATEKGRAAQPKPVTAGDYRRMMLAQQEAAHARALTQGKRDPGTGYHVVRSHPQRGNFGLTLASLPHLDGTPRASVLNYAKGQERLMLLRKDLRDGSMTKRAATVLEILRNLEHLLLLPDALKVWDGPKVLRSLEPILPHLVRMVGRDIAPDSAFVAANPRQVVTEALEALAALPELLGSGFAPGAQQLVMLLTATANQSPTGA